MSLRSRFETQHLISPPAGWPVGATVLIPAVRGQRFAVYSALLSAAATSTFYFADDNGTPISGLITLAANQPLALDQVGNTDPWFLTDDRRGLAIVVMTGTVFGDVYYMPVPGSFALPSSVWSLLAKTGLLSATTTVTTAPTNTNGADLLVVVAQAEGAPTISDSLGNTWVAASSASLPPAVTIYYATNPKTGGSQTFTASGATATGIFVMAWSGSLAGASADQANGASLPSATTTMQPGTITPIQDNELLVVAATWGAVPPASMTVSDGFTVQGFFPVAAGTYGLGVATLVQRGAAAIDPTLTFNAASTGGACVIASFKAAVP